MLTFLPLNINLSHIAHPNQQSSYQANQWTHKSQHWCDLNTSRSGDSIAPEYRKLRAMLLLYLVSNTTLAWTKCWDKSGPFPRVHIIISLGALRLRSERSIRSNRSSEHIYTIFCKCMCVCVCVFLVIEVKPISSFQDRDQDMEMMMMMMMMMMMTISSAELLHWKLNWSNLLFPPCILTHSLLLNWFNRLNLWENSGVLSFIEAN